MTKVSVAVMPFQGELCTFHCMVCITGEVGKDGKGIMVWHTRQSKQRAFEASKQLGPCVWEISGAASVKHK